jgi:hypothetical protein
MELSKLKTPVLHILSGRPALFKKRPDPCWKVDVKARALMMSCIANEDHKSDLGVSL